MIGLLAFSSEAALLLLRRGVQPPALMFAAKRDMSAEPAASG